MKSLYVTICLLLLSLCTEAQLFHIGPDSVAVSGTTDDLFLEAHTTLTNLQDTAINVGWKREVLSIPDAWINYLCSDFLCYLPESDSGNIYVQPGQAMDVNMTFFPQDVPGNGLVRVSFFDTTDVEGSAMHVMYACEASLSTSVADQTAGPISIYPNPAQNVIQITCSWQLQRVQLFGPSGIPVMAAENICRLDIHHLPRGWYYLVAHHQGGRSVSAFQKI